MEGMMELPDEVLLIIFANLPARELRKLMQVSKRFRDLICNSKNLMELLPLILEKNWKKENKFLLNFHQKFQKIIIADIGNWNKHLLKIFKKHGPHVRELEFKRCNFEDSTWLVQILKLLPHIEVLKLYSTDVLEEYDDDEITEADSVYLPKLTFVRIIDSSLETFRFLKKSSNIDCLKIKCSAMDHYEVNPFIQFIKNQQKLKVLALKGLSINNSELFTTDISKDLKFRLRVLSLENLSFETTPLDVNLLNFLKSQPDIEEIEIGKHFSSRVYKVIFQEMKNLKTVSIRGEFIPAEFKEVILANTSVRKLVIRGQIKDRLSPLKEIINLLPNLKIVKFLDSNHACCQETLMYLANNLEKLEELELCRCTNRNFSAVKFTNLKILRIEWGDEIEFSGWKQITNNNQHLETLSLRWGKDLKNKTINLIIKNLKHLKHLKIGTGFECTQSVFNSMKKNKSLKLVEILKDNLANINLPINEMQSLCQTNGITLKVYESLPDIFKEEHYEWLEEMQDYYDLESSDFTDSDDSDDDFEMTSDDDERIYVGHGLDVNMRHFIDFINIMNPNGAFQEDSDNSGYESDLAIPFQLRQLASDSDDG